MQTFIHTQNIYECMGRKTTDINERFWKFVQIPENKNDCWIWNGYKNRAGYGWFHVSGHTLSNHAQRISWELTYGHPGKAHVLHKCDNPACVNPDHLFLGDQKANMKDMHLKNRHAKGETNGISYLKEEDIIKIREMYLTKKYTHMELAVIFNTTRRHIGHIINRQVWKHIQ